MINHGQRSLLDTETVHQELMTCNPMYALAVDHIVALPDG